MTVNTYSDLIVCNIALNLIGQKPINSIIDTKTDTEATCARLYPLTVASLLARHDWNFANPVAELAHNADITPLGGKKYAYKLPSDLLAGPFAVYTAQDLDRPVHHYINANDHIHSDEETCFVRYRRWPPIETWPGYFVDLVATALAARLSKPVADDSEMATELRIQAFGDARQDGDGGLMKAAKLIDAKSQPQKTFFRNGDPLTRLVY